MQTIARLYDHYSDAIAVVRELEAAAMSHDSISLVANSDAHGRQIASPTLHSSTDGSSAIDPAAADDTPPESGAKRGSLLGGALGGGVGLLTGIGALAIPGVGPVVAAGWLVATLAGVGVGAASGGLIGSLAGAGVDEKEATVYSEGVKRGGTLVSIRLEDTDVGRAEAIMHRHNPVDWQERQTAYADPNYDSSVAATHGATVYPDPTVTGTDGPLSDPANFGERKRIIT